MTEDRAPKPASDAQLKFIQKLAIRATGDGGIYLAALLAANGGSLTMIQASAEIKRLQAVPEMDRSQHQPKKITTEAPPGRYAVELPGVRGSTLVELTKPTSGQWKGFQFVRTVPIFEGGAPEPIKGKMAVQVIEQIDGNPRGTAAIYGQITGRCGQCNRRLSDRSSVEMGIGPECMSHFDHIPDRFSGTNDLHARRTAG